MLTFSLFYCIINNQLRENYIILINQTNCHKIKYKKKNIVMYYKEKKKGIGIMNDKYIITGGTVCISTDNGYKPENYKTYTDEILILENFIETCNKEIQENNSKQKQAKKERKSKIQLSAIISSILISLILININSYNAIIPIIYSICSGTILGITTTTVLSFLTKNKYNKKIKSLEENNLNIANIKEKYEKDLKIFNEKSAIVPAKDLYKDNDCREYNNETAKKEKITTIYYPVSESPSLFEKVSNKPKSRKLTNNI